MPEKNNKHEVRKGWRVFYWFALGLILLLYGAQNLLCYLAGSRDPYPVTSSIILLIIIIVVVAYKWAFNKMAGFADDVEQLLLHSSEDRSGAEARGWYEAEFRQIFDFRKSILFASFFTLVAAMIAANIKVAVWLPSLPAVAVGATMYVLIGTAFGACVWPGYRMFVFIHRLTGSLRRINPFAPASVGIFNIGRTFMKFEAVGVILLLMFGAGFEMSPYQLSNKLILISATVVSVIWAFWFFFTQGKIHAVMLNYKHEKQSWFAHHYETALTKVLRRPDQESFEELQRLIVLKNEIDSIPVWPFNARALVTSLGLIISPIIAALVQRVIGQ